MDFLTKKSFREINYSAHNALNLIRQNKVLLLTDYDLEGDPLAFFSIFSDQLGQIYDADEDLLTGQSTGNRWIDITYDPEVMDKYRSAPVAQPLHTDASYLDIRNNIQFFYCTGQAKLGGATTFIDAEFVVELLELAGESELKYRLMNTVVLFSKDNRQKLSPILWVENGMHHFNWNYYCGNSNSDEVRDLFEKFHDFLERRIVKSGLLTEVLLQKNDAVFFHDELVLHGRNAYFATEKGERSLNKGTILLG